MSEYIKHMDLSGFRGHIGELNVMMELAKTGGSINSMTESDYGIDAIYQCPRDLLAFDEKTMMPVIFDADERKYKPISSTKQSEGQRQTVKWPVTDPIINIQVKYRSNNGSISFDEEYARDLVYRARAGRPMIFFLCAPTGNYIVDPAAFYSELTNNLISNEEGTGYHININSGNGVIATSRMYVPLFKLWGSYPEILLIIGGLKGICDKNEGSYLKKIIAVLTRCYLADNQVSLEDMTGYITGEQSSRLPETIYEEYAAPFIESANIERDKPDVIKIIANSVLAVSKEAMFEFELSEEGRHATHAIYRNLCHNQNSVSEICLEETEEGRNYIYHLSKYEKKSYRNRLLSHTQLNEERVRTIGMCLSIVREAGLS